MPLSVDNASYAEVFVTARKFASAFLLLFPWCLFAANWRSIDPADLASTQSKVQATADAEGLFREVRVLNEQHGNGYAKNILAEYVRLKIFTDRGKDKYSNVQIPYVGKTNVFDVEARTVHRDGSIVELKRDAIFDKVVERSGGLKVNVVSFAMPGVEAGSIIEYRFHKDYGESVARYTRLDVQSEFPVDDVTFLIKPLTSAYVHFPEMRMMPFGCAPERLGSTPDGFSIIKVRNVPAFHEEPYSPPEMSAKQWILIYYEENEKTGQDQYWTLLGRERFKEYSDKVKVNGEVKDLAGQITTGATSDDDKLAKLVEFCRTQIKDVRGDNVTTQEVNEAKENKTSVDTLKRRMGNRRDINFAFAALANASGFETRIAYLSDRATFLFRPEYQSAYFLNAYNIAVRVKGAWKFFDVANVNVAPGQLRWQEQGVYALIADPKTPEFIQTPLLTADESKVNRMATLTLTADGAVEGDIREMYWGNRATHWRQRLGRANEAQREESVRETMKHRFSNFELSAVKFTVSPDTSKPVGLTYHVAVPHYAQKTGKRLFIMPDFFAVGNGNRFTETERFNGIYFEYPWSEVDSVQLKIPEGFALDHGDTPKGVNYLPAGKYVVSIGFDKAQNAIVYQRSMTFGADKLPTFPASEYSTMKKIFDQIHDSDHHLLTVKADTPTGTDPTPGSK